MPDDKPAHPTILVVEDEKPIRQLLEMALQQHGFAVLLAATGAEAVLLYRRHRDTITLVLLDVQMDGMDGPGTLAALQQIDPHVRCCFMSGCTGRYTSGQLLEMGAARVLPKPFASLSELAQTLRTVSAGEGVTGDG